MMIPALLLLSAALGSAARAASYPGDWCASAILRLEQQEAEGRSNLNSCRSSLCRTAWKARLRSLSDELESVKAGCDDCAALEETSRKLARAESEAATNAEKLSACRDLAIRCDRLENERRQIEKAVSALRNRYREEKLECSASRPPPGL